MVKGITCTNDLHRLAHDHTSEEWCVVLSAPKSWIHTCQEALKREGTVLS